MDPIVGLVLLAGAAVAVMVAGLLPNSTDTGPQLSFRGLLPASAQLDGRTGLGPQEWLDIVADSEVQSALQQLEDHGARPVLRDYELTLDGDDPADPQFHARLQCLYDAIEHAAWRPWDPLLPKPEHRGESTERTFPGRFDGFDAVVDVRGDIVTWSARLTLHLDIPTIDLPAFKERYASEKRQLVLSPEGLTLTLTPDDAHAGLARAVELASEIELLLETPWDTSEAGLPVTRINAQQWRASLHGVHLKLHKVGGDLRIEARLTRPLPAGTLLVHAEHGLIDRPIGDPILDALITVQSSDVGAVRARISTDDVRGPLLDLIHAHPGSQVAEHHVSARLQPPLRGHVRSIAAKVVALVRALDDQAIRTSKA